MSTTTSKKPLAIQAKGDCLTVGELLEFLNKVVEKHGPDMQVNHVEFGGLTPTHYVSVDKVRDGSLILVLEN